MSIADKVFTAFLVAVVVLMVLDIVRAWRDGK